MSNKESELEHIHRQDDLASSTKEWYAFAKAPNLDSWREHFISKNIPHAIIRCREHGHTMRELWVRYDYDHRIGGSLLSAKSKQKFSQPPACILNLCES